MNLDKIIVASAGFFLIGFIYWFFFGKKNEAIEAGDGLKVLVSGGYKPDIIKLKRGVKITLIFKRTDPNSCLEELFIPDFKIKKYLPLDKEIKISINPKHSGSWDFHCGMNMYHGKLIVD